MCWDLRRCNMLHSIEILQEKRFVHISIVATKPCSPLFWNAVLAIRTWGDIPTASNVEVNNPCVSCNSPFLFCKSVKKEIFFLSIYIFINILSLTDKNEKDLFCNSSSVIDKWGVVSMDTELLVEICWLWELSSGTVGFSITCVPSVEPNLILPEVFYQTLRIY